MNTLDIKILAEALNRRVTGWQINNAYGYTECFIIHLSNPDDQSKAGSLVFRRMGDVCHFYFERSFPKPPQESWKPNLKGFTVEEVKAIDNDRIISISIRNEAQSGRTLFVEMTGRRSNLILTDEDRRIITSLVKIGDDTNRYRRIASGEIYKLPPAMKKQCPSIMSSIPIWENWLNDYEIARKESTIGSEIFWSELKDLSDNDPEASIKIISEAVNLASPITLITERGEILPFISSRGEVFNCAIDAFYAIAHADEGDFKSREYIAVEEEIARLLGKVEALEKQLSLWHNEDYYRQRADTLAANLHKISKKDTSISLSNVHNPEEIFEIDLQSKLSPSENLSALYKKAQKAQSIKETLPPLIDSLKEKIKRYQEALGDDKQLGEISETVEKSAPKLTRRQQFDKRDYRSFEYKGYQIFVGKNAKGNDYITLRLAKPSDIWLHARGVSGSHVIIKSKKQVPFDVIIAAAEIAAFYSNHRNQTTAEVIYTERRWVQKVKGKIGAVRTLKDKTAIVKPPRDVSKYRITGDIQDV